MSKPQACVRPSRSPAIGQALLQHHLVAAIQNVKVEEFDVFVESPQTRTYIALNTYICQTHLVLDRSRAPVPIWHSLSLTLARITQVVLLLDESCHRGTGKLLSSPSTPTSVTS